MALGEEVLVTVSSELVQNVSFILTLVKAIGVVAAIYVIFQAVNIYFNFRRLQELQEIKESINQITKKLARKK